MSQTTIHSVRRIAFPHHEADGMLTEFSVMADAVSFPILRVFTITGVSAGGVRGDHAHRGCTQLLACLSGRVTVDVDDGAQTSTEVLEPGGTGLLIPPMLWNSETFEGPTTVLAVFCDELYDPADYVRDREEYTRLKRMERGASE
jgi:dTDP-4-dehydrorhamnose 3,5-epimerase-like enzyme